MCICCKVIPSRGQLLNRLSESCIVIAFFPVHLLFVSIKKYIVVRQHKNEEGIMICDDLVEELFKNKK